MDGDDVVELLEATNAPKSNRTSNKPAGRSSSFEFFSVFFGRTTTDVSG